MLARDDRRTERALVDDAPRQADTDPHYDFRPESPDPAIRMRTVTEDQPELWERAERFLYEIYRLSGFCEESPRGWVEEIDAYRAGTTLHVAMDGDTIVGTARSMFGTYDELPIGRFRPEVVVPAGMMSEVGSLAVGPSMRGLGVVNELHRRSFQFALRAGARGLCMLMEPWSVGFFREVYGLPLIQTAPAQVYLGSETMPVLATFQDMLGTAIRIRPYVFDWILEGVEPEVRAELDLPIRLA